MRVISNFPNTKTTSNSHKSDFDLSTAIKENGSTRFYAHKTLDNVFLIRSVNTINGTDFKEAELEVRIWQKASTIHYTSSRADSGASPSLNSSENGQIYAELNLNYAETGGLPSNSNLDNITPTHAIDPQNTSESLKNRTTRVLLEFSWPLNFDYDKRQKETLFFWPTNHH